MLCNKLIHCESARFQIFVTRRSTLLLSSLFGTLQYERERILKNLKTIILASLMWYISSIAGFCSRTSRLKEGNNRFTSSDRSTFNVRYVSRFGVLGILVFPAFSLWKISSARNIIFYVLDQSTPNRQIVTAVKSPILFKLRQWIKKGEKNVLAKGILFVMRCSRDIALWKLTFLILPWGSFSPMFFSFPSPF